MGDETSAARVRSAATPSQGTPSHPLEATLPSGSQNYVLVTAVKNEQQTLGVTLASVLAQSVRPIEWVIVNDGSTDSTREIVDRASEQYPWIRALHREPSPHRSFAAVVHALEAGLRHLRSTDYEFVGILDGDIHHPANYYERMLREFAGDPQLGLVGGVVIDVGLPRDRFPRNRLDVPGAVQFFRRSCFERFGGLLPIPEGGWDGLTCAMARMNGYTTRLLTDVVVDHLKPRNISEGGVLRRKWQMGVRDYAMGYHPLFEATKCLGRIAEPPLLLGAMAWGIGYCMASIQDRTIIVPANVVAFVRREQLARVRQAAGFSTQFEPLRNDSIR